jgi:hypothetical protein
VIDDSATNTQIGEGAKFTSATGVETARGFYETKKSRRYKILSMSLRKSHSSHETGD